MSGLVPGETPEGWYSDPQADASTPPGRERWWNGVQWTAHTRSPAPAPEPVLVSGAAPPPTGGPRGFTTEGLLQGFAPVEVRTSYGAVLAGPAPRFQAWLVDFLLVWLLALPLLLVVQLGLAVAGGLAGASEVSLSGVDMANNLVAMTVAFGYHALALWRGGASLGQRTARIGVRPYAVNARLSGRQVLLRAALMMVPFVSGGFWVLVFVAMSLPVFAGTTRRGFHEVWSDTCTVHTRVPAS